jgi:aerobic carbon-monoxide dehydrogenase small subunit
MKIDFILNGKAVSLKANPEDRLIDILRKKFGITSCKDGCGEGECGACLVYLENDLVNSCLVPAYKIINKKVNTYEGLASNEINTTIKRIFKQRNVFTCGFCESGIVMSVSELLLHNEDPDENDIKEALSGNICNCNGYNILLDAINEVIGKINAKR